MIKITERCGGLIREKESREPRALFAHRARRVGGRSVRRSIKIRVMCPRLRENTVMLAAANRARLRRGLQNVIGTAPSIINR